MGIDLEPLTKASGAGFQGEDVLVGQSQNVLVHISFSFRVHARGEERAKGKPGVGWVTAEPAGTALLCRAARSPLGGRYSGFGLSIVRALGL